MNESRGPTAKRLDWDFATRNERLKTVSLAVGAWQSTKAGVKLLEATKAFERDPFEYRLLMTGVAVTYSRPFGNNYGLASLPREMLNFDDVKLHHQHEELLLTRRKLYGHTDANYRWNVESLPFGIEISFRINDRGKVEVVPIVPAPDISPDSLATISRLAETQILRALDLMAGLMGDFLTSGKTFNIGQTYRVEEDSS